MTCRVWNCKLTLPFQLAWTLNYQPIPLWVGIVPLQTFKKSGNNHLYFLLSLISLIFINLGFLTSLLLINHLPDSLTANSSFSALSYQSLSSSCTKCSSSSWAFWLHTLFSPSLPLFLPDAFFPLSALLTLWFPCVSEYFFHSSSICNSY